MELEFAQGKLQENVHDVCLQQVTRGLREQVKEMEDMKVEGIRIELESSGWTKAMTAQKISSRQSVKALEKIPSLPSKT